MSRLLLVLFFTGLSFYASATEKIDEDVDLLFIEGVQELCTALAIPS